MKLKSAIVINSLDKLNDLEKEKNFITFDYEILTKNKQISENEAEIVQIALENKQIKSDKQIMEEKNGLQIKEMEQKMNLLFQQLEIKSKETNILIEEKNNLEDECLKMKTKILQMEKELNYLREKNGILPQKTIENSI